VCLACEDVVLGYGWVCVFVVVSVVKSSLGGLLQQLLCSSGIVPKFVDVVLFYGYVGVFIVVSVVKCSLLVLLQQLLCSSCSVS